MLYWKLILSVTHIYASDTCQSQNKYTLVQLSFYDIDALQKGINSDANSAASEADEDLHCRSRVAV